jgi:hypothetical protein
MIDAVWTVGHHPSLCGTEKFGHLLAKKLGVPCVPMGTQTTHPLISVRASEVERWPHVNGAYDLFLHDWYSYDGTILAVLKHATRVYAANPVIAREVRDYRADVIEAFAPSTIEGNPSRGTINVLTFGMAHKLSVHHGRYTKLKALLDDAPTDYTVSVSTAIHEGSPWDDTARVADELRGIFGTHLRVLGYLADDALARELVDCTAVAVFYDPALRANNTTYHAAADRSKTIITNLDADSPETLPCVYDVDALNEWPAQGFGFHFDTAYSWRSLLGLLQGQTCAT